MFTIKFYSSGGPGAYRQLILSAESFTILRDECGAEITLHQADANKDRRIDVSNPGVPREHDGAPSYQRAIIENSAGRTSEIISAEGPK